MILHLDVATRTGEPRAPVRETRCMEEGWDAAIERFREVTHVRAAQQAYLDLLVDAQARWQSVVRVHPWRLDVLVFEARAGSEHEVWVEHRVRDGMQVLVFKLGPAGSMNAEPVVAGDICGLATAPAVLDSFLYQIAEPVEKG
jgi:hypothetical protein